ncbi:integrase arm-type DNA-binding domain-containing protein [Candidatus Rariloculus sp.]|uniref:integrase arm-type DNA-binding domain-containing protein n=1 Tax=Candidatus Rariloculus sp. TaxID=3101265 RepID=UPI003D0C9E5A
MRIYAHLNESTVRRTVQNHVKGKRGLTVHDKKLRGFGLKVTPAGKTSFFVRTVRRTGSRNVILGEAGTMSAAEARRKAVAELDAARTDRINGPVFRDYAEEFMRRQARRWKTSTQEGNRHFLDRYLLPFFADMHVRDIARSDVRLVRCHEPDTRQC